MKSRETNNIMKVSIITINYNNKAGLERTMQSVLSQTVYDRIEYIVVDGASTDGSAKVLKQHESLLSYAISEPDKGIYNAMNKGVVHATGDYCLFLNSGDFLRADDIIERCMPKLGTEDLVMGKVETWPTGRIGYEDIRLPFTMMDFFQYGPVPHMACFIRRKLFDKNLYDESLRIVADWKFFMNAIVFDGCTCKLIEDVVSYLEEGGISANRYECDKERAKVLKGALPEAIYLDYNRFVNGEHYGASNYDSFFSDLKNYNERCAKLVYRLSLSLVAMLSWRFKSLKFVEKYR